MSLILETILDVENLNHPEDFHICFNGGVLTFNQSNGPLRFWHNGELIVLETRNDALKFRQFIADKKLNPEAMWQDRHVTKLQLINMLQTLIEDADKARCDNGSVVSNFNVDRAKKLLEAAKN